MQKSFVLSLLLAVSSTAALAQTTDPAATQTQPAPIVRPYSNPATPYPGYAAPPQITRSQPIAGVLLRSESGASVQTISADAKGTELRLDHGRANVSVRHPGAGVQILVDLPGGQISLLKDGLYTFNADTNTVRVLKGEAAAYPGAANSGARPVKIKEAHQLDFAATQKGLRSVEVNNPRQLTADLLPYGDGNPGGGGYPGRGYGYSPYGDGYYGYGYPYYAYGWGPYWGYPYGFGLGFGYYGGFRGGFGGFRGRR